MRSSSVLISRAGYCAAPSMDEGESANSLIASDRGGQCCWPFHGDVVAGTRPYAELGVDG